MDKLEAVNFTQFTQNSSSSGQWYCASTFNIQSITNQNDVITITYYFNVVETGVWPSSNSGTDTIQVNIANGTPTMVKNSATIQAVYSNDMKYYGSVSCDAPYIFN